MTGEEIVEGLKLLEDNMVHFDELQNDKGEWIDVHELLFEAIQALEQQPCEDAISKQAMFEILTKYNLEMSKIAEDMNKLPPAVPQQKYGKWILADEQNKEDVENDNYRFICSECQCSDIHAKGTIVPYCWKCGAKMQESEEVRE